MKSERDATRIVQAWLEVGSTGIPDRVLDAVVAELPSRPQRRPRWWPWRSFKMKPIIPLAAGVAVVLLAVVLGSRFLSNGPSIGGPTSSPTLSPTPVAVAGQFTFAGGEPVTVDASSDGSSLSGTVEGAWAGKPFSIRLECLRQFDPQTWMLAGRLTQSADANRSAGDWGALVVRDGSPQKVGVWTEASSTGDDCTGFVYGIPDQAADEGQQFIGPMDEGSMTLPPAHQGSAKGQVTFNPAVAGVASIDVDATADGTTLSGSAVISGPAGTFTIGLDCLRRFDEQTWILGGQIDQSSIPGYEPGMRRAVIVRDTLPQQAANWGPEASGAADCAEFVSTIPNFAIDSTDALAPVTEGAISLR